MRFLKNLETTPGNVNAGNSGATIQNHGNEDAAALCLDSDESADAPAKPGSLEQQELQAEIIRLREELALVSRLASMAEVATGTLHNVGNVLTSINVSASMVKSRLRESRVANLAKALLLLREHRSDLAAFLQDDPKGKMLPAYLETLADHLSGEQSELLREMDTMGKDIEHVKEIVAMQQNYAKVCGVTETIPAADLVDDALRMNLGAFERHGVTVVREFADVPPVKVDKHKVLQILVNVMRNAKYAMDELAPAEKRLTVSIGLKDDSSVAITVRDNGTGISRENLARIFSRGFTTKRDGHGFGLHSGRQVAQELGGQLTVSSDGPGKGAAFCLELPAGTTA
jgi:signal transduction histidine kinase